MLVGAAGLALRPFLLVRGRSADIPPPPPALSLGGAAQVTSPGL